MHVIYTCTVVYIYIYEIIEIIFCVGVTLKVEKKTQKLIKCLFEHLTSIFQKNKQKKQTPHHPIKSHLKFHFLGCCGVMLVTQQVKMLLTSNIAYY